MVTNLTLIDSIIGGLDDFMTSLDAKDNLETLKIIKYSEQNYLYEDEEIVH